MGIMIGVIIRVIRVVERMLSGAAAKTEFVKDSTQRQPIYSHRIMCVLEAVVVSDHAC
jgi:hypothetical protein